MYRNLGANMAEVLRLAGGRTEDLDPRVRFEGEERVQEALARGRGVLILTAHVGNWDLLAMLTARSRYRLTVISKSLRNAALNDMWMRIRRHFGVAILPAHQSYRMCLRVLRRNELLGFILDQNRPREEGIFVDFFGRPACTSPGLAFMSAQSGAPVVPAFILREGEERHVVRVLPLIEPPPDREAETIRRATQHYTKIIEDVVREHPDQWLWLHRRWKTQPERQVPCRNGWPGGQPRGIGADIEQGEVRS
jgi:KDO2-lipid IV(A) lauroyltransferase